MDNPLGKQVGGDHYKKMKIQPIEYAVANNLGPCEFLALRYISRRKGPNRIQDLEKAIHSLEMLIQFERKNESVEQPSPTGSITGSFIIPGTVRLENWRDADTTVLAGFSYPTTTELPENVQSGVVGVHWGLDPATGKLFDGDD